MGRGSTFNPLIKDIFYEDYKGSIAEREHRKWSESAVAMPNNPYTQEKLWERKISRTQFNNFPMRKR